MKIDKYGWKQRFLKPGFHYPTSRPEFTGRVDGPWTQVHFWHTSWQPELTGVKKCTIVDGPSIRVHFWHPTTRPVNSGSGNRDLESQSKHTRQWHTVKNSSNPTQFPHCFPHPNPVPITTIPIPTPCPPACHPVPNRTLHRPFLWRYSRFMNFSKMYKNVWECSQ